MEVNKIAAVLGAEKSLPLPPFHALSGCDQVSSFYGKAKKTAWDIWNDQIVTPALATLS